MERVEGAPTLPVQGNLEQDLLEALRMLRNGEITQEQYDAIRARLMGAAADEVSAMFRPPEEVIAESQAARAPITPPTVYPEDGQMPTDPLAGMVGRPGNRALPPRIAEEQRSADQRQYGARWGGGEPFRSTGEREAYGGRRLMSDSEKDAERRRLQEAGVPDDEIENRIVEMQRSDRDRDAAQAGYSSGSGGWVPYYDEKGEEVLGMRAPDPVYETPRAEYSQTMPAPEESREPLASMFSLRGRTVPQAATVPGPAIPGPQAPFDPPEESGTTNRLTGNRRVGPRVDSGQRTPSLRRPDLERLGYEAVTVQGPYGPERVYLPPGVRNPNTGARQALPIATRNRVADRIGLENYQDMTDEELRDAERSYDSTQRLRVKAGLGPDDDPTASPQRLRQIIASNRQRDKDNRMGNVTKRAMFQTNPIALQGQEGLNDWERLAIDRRMGGGSDTTPIDRDARQMEASWRLAQAALAGGANAETMRAAREMQESQMEPAEAARLSRQRGEPMGTGGSARFVQTAWNNWFVAGGPSSPRHRRRRFTEIMMAEGYSQAEIDDYLRRNPPPAPASGVDAALPPDYGFDPPPALTPPGTPPPRGSNPRFR